MESADIVAARNFTSEHESMLSNIQQKSAQIVGNSHDRLHNIWIEIADSVSVIGGVFMSPMKDLKSTNYSSPT